MDDLKIPIDKVEASISFDKERKIEGTIFLSMVQWDMPLSSKVSAYLEDEKEFIPFQVKGSKPAELINKKNIKTVEWKKNADAGEGEFPDTSHKQEVTLFFNDNDSISGTLISQTTPDRLRLSDCLNSQGSFIHITDGERHIHVNKKMLLRVTSP